MACLICTPAWAETVYCKPDGSTVYYQVGATTCTDVDSGDTPGPYLENCEDAAVGGSTYICSAEYTNDMVDTDGIVNATSDVYVERGAKVRGSIYSTNKSLYAFGSGNKPIITGMDASTGYTVVSGTVYSKSTITTRPDVVTYNGVRLADVEYKLNFNSGSIEPVVGEYLDEGGSDGRGMVLNVVLSSGTWAGGDAAGYINLTDTRGTWLNNTQINGSVGGSNMATANGNWVVATTDLAINQYAWSTNTVYINVGEDPDSGTLEIAQRDRAVSVIAASSIVVDSINIIGSNYYGVLSNTSTNITVSSCDFSDINERAIWIDEDNTGWVISKNTFVDCNVAIYVYPSVVTNMNVIIDGNEISGSSSYRAQNQYMHAVYIRNVNGGTIVSNNYIHDTTGDGIFLYESDSIVIHGNQIVDVKDGIALESSDSNVVVNNTLPGNSDTLGGGFNWPRIKLGDAFGAGTAADSNIIKNNIMYANDHPAGNHRCLSGNPVGNNNVIDYNHYYTEDDVNPIYWNENGESTFDGNLVGFQAIKNNAYEQNAPVQADPMLTYQYTLKPTSPAINVGDNNVAQRLPCDGIIDIGAREFCKSLSGVQLQ